MKRRKAREYALQLLYSYDLSGEVITGSSLKEFWKEHQHTEDVREFTEDLVFGTINNLEEIDELISSVTEHWDLKRMAAVDRNILRFATYELLFRDDIPAAVTLNEAIEIAKRFSSKESSSFINGVLDRITKKIKKRVH
ncbi:MAG: transcription antitermination factor NusB [Nitrospirae bacterium]|nr:MAG: transcription antitermination factor NusB [Nitrospirota bacterium]